MVKLKEKLHEVISESEVQVKGVVAISDEIDLFWAKKGTFFQIHPPGLREDYSYDFKNSKRF